MLNRRQLRIKVLQALYAYFQAGSNDIVKGEKELMAQVSRIYDLYVLYLLIFEDIRLHAANRLDEAARKKLPTHEDLHPNMRFVENEVLLKLSVNKALQAEGQRRKLNWNNEQELVRKLFSDLRHSAEYQEYMAAPVRSFEQDRDFVTLMFREYIANSEHLLHFLEEKSIHWIDDIDLVCAAVIKTLRSLEPSSDEFFKLIPLYKDEEEDARFVRHLFRRAVLDDNDNETIISSKTENWEMERIAAMDMLLMKMAITEVKEFDTIPVKVTLNEYIEISKFYSTPKSNGFINGILDKVFNELKATGHIRKIGRGLIEE